MKVNGKNLTTIWFEKDIDQIKIIDQRFLPHLITDAGPHLYVTGNPAGMDVIVSIIVLFNFDDEPQRSGFVFHKKPFVPGCYQVSDLHYSFTSSMTSFLFVGK